MSTQLRSLARHAAPLLLVAGLLAAAPALPAAEIGERIAVEMHRGDADGDGTLSAADAQTMLGLLFSDAPRLVSARDVDFDADGDLDIVDVIALQAYLTELEDGSGPALLSMGTALLGDANDDGAVDLADAVHLLGYLFQGAGHPNAPLGACDANENDAVNLTDVIAILYAVA